MFKISDRVKVNSIYRPIYTQVVAEKFKPFLNQIGTVECVFSNVSYSIVFDAEINFLGRRSCRWTLKSTNFTLHEELSRELLISSYILD